VSTSTQNRQFRLAARPVGLVKSSDFRLTEEAVRPPAEGEVLVRTQYISLDPAMRGWMNDVKSYVPPVGLDEVMRAGTAGEVIESKHPNFKAGDAVSGAWGAQTFGTVGGPTLTKVDTSVAPLPVYLGTLGMPGMTAYFGLLDVGQPKPGETVVVSGAAGAVGTVVGQIAKIKGCRVVGIAGGKRKCDYLVQELGFDAALDYKSGDLKSGLRKECPKGVNVYFDNVGGSILDTLLTRLAPKARIVICGAISQYNNEGAMEGPRNYMSLLVFRARMEGMVVFDYADRFPTAVREMTGWMKDGTLKPREDVVTGFDRFPEALLMLFKGENLGKLVLKVD
jgi:NADPH-dependent curcumin reductase CurA